MLIFGNSNNTILRSDEIYIIRDVADTHMAFNSGKSDVFICYFKRTSIRLLMQSLRNGSAITKKLTESNLLHFVQMTKQFSCTECHWSVMIFAERAVKLFNS